MIGKRTFMLVFGYCKLSFDAASLDFVRAEAMSGEFAFSLVSLMKKVQGHLNGNLTANFVNGLTLTVQYDCRNVGFLTATQKMVRE